MKRSPVTTHVLDTSRGVPAAGIDIVLEVETADGFQYLGKGTTDSDGRLGSLLPETYRLEAAAYRLIFEVGPYFKSLSERSFFPSVVIVFRIDDPDQHHHVPLLLSPFGYTTYRGS